MRVTTWAWFDTKKEQKEFIECLNSSRSDIEATNKLCDKYPEIPMRRLSELVENWKKEINKKDETK